MFLGLDFVLLLLLLRRVCPRHGLARLGFVLGLALSPAWLCPWLDCVPCLDFFLTWLCPWLGLVLGLAWLCAWICRLRFWLSCPCFVATLAWNCPLLGFSLAWLCARLVFVPGLAWRCPWLGLALSPVLLGLLGSAQPGFVHGCA